MMEVNKQKNNQTNTYDILFKDNDIIFKMTFAPNMDLYWHVRSLNWSRVDKDYGYYDFKITKENFIIYDLFNNLYENIIKAHIFEEQPIDDFSSLKEYEENIKLKNKRNNSLLATDSYQALVKDGVITWVSDDTIDDENDSMYYLFPPTFVTIKKDNDAIYLEFKAKLIKKRNKTSVSIRFRTSGSAYDYFYIPFIKLYRSLQEYEETKQIHIEEYLYLTRHK